MNEIPESAFERLASLQAEDFVTHLQSGFRIQFDESDVELHLVEVSRYRERENAIPISGREPFSLLFRAGQRLGQGQYELVHEKLGRLSIFLAPVTVPEAGGDNSEVHHYEAVFS